MKYKDFNIRIGGKKWDGGYAISIGSPAGEGNARITLTRDLDEILASLSSLGQKVRGNSPVLKSESGRNTRDADMSSLGTLQPIDVGRELFNDLFVGRIRSLFDTSLGRIQGTDDGLRIKLHIDPENTDVARLASLPWELLYNEESRNYLNLSTTTPLVRYLDVPLPFEPLPFKPPLRILVVVSNPDGTSTLDLDKERDSIEKSWGNQSDVEVDFLARASVQELSSKLKGADYHVLHYMGHGDFDAKKGAGVLVMEDEVGQADLVDGTTLGVILHDEKSIRMVFLNACNTAKLGYDGAQDPFAGVATALVMAGIPAVVAMQFPISDGAAITFTESFYPQLAKGIPVDAAVSEGRKAIRINDRMSMEWSTPVLFMRSPNGRLFSSEGLADQRSGEKDSQAIGDIDVGKEAELEDAEVAKFTGVKVDGEVGRIGDVNVAEKAKLKRVKIESFIGVDLSGDKSQAEEPEERGKSDD